MAMQLGKTVVYENAPGISFWASCVGKKEGEGPFKEKFDRIFSDTTLGKESWEESESELIKNAAQIAIAKGKYTWQDIDCIFSGDLLSQCIASNYAFSGIGTCFCGLYGACSTMALALINAANFIESGGAKRALAATGSHFCSSERQFRFPLEYGSQRAPTAQWTVTGAGAALLESGSSAAEKIKVKVRAARFGEITDLGVTDANNMGAAMAPVSVRIGYIRERNPSVQILRRYAVFSLFLDKIGKNFSSKKGKNRLRHFGLIFVLFLSRVATIGTRQ